MNNNRKNELGPMIAEALACCPYQSQDAIADYIAEHIALNEKRPDQVDEAMAVRFLEGTDRGLIDSRRPFNSDDIALVTKGLRAALQPSF